jgi:hypothetical protein
MHEILLFLFYVEKKNLVKDQFIINKCLSAYLLQIVHLRIEKNIYIKAIMTSRHHHRQYCHSFQKNWYYYIIQMRKEKEKERKTILHYV